MDQNQLLQDLNNKLNFQYQINHDKNYFYKLKEKYSNIDLIQLINFCKKQHIKFNTRYSYVGIIRLLKQYPNFNSVQQLFNKCTKLGLENYAKKYKLVYGNLIIIFYLYNLPIDEAKQYNIDRIRIKGKKNKLNKQQIQQLKEDLKNNKYQYYNEPAKKFNITINSLKNYIKKYNLEYYIDSAINTKDYTHNKADYRKWLKQIQQDKLDKIIDKKFLQQKESINNIYNYLLNVKNGFLYYKNEKYCPLMYYIYSQYKTIKQLPGEIWKVYPYEPFNKYLLISNLGRIYKKPLNTSKGKILSNSWDGHNYLITHLSINGKIYHIRAHQLIAKTFIKNSQNKLYIDHINTIRFDNRVSNLRWVTQTENNNNILTRQKQRKRMQRVFNNDIKRKEKFVYSNTIKCYAEHKNGQKVYANSLIDLARKFNTKAHLNYYVNKGFIKNKKSKLKDWRIVKLEDNKND